MPNEPKAPLMPCPLPDCGGEAMAENTITEGGVHCRKCRLSIWRKNSPHSNDDGYLEAIRLWNLRPALPLPPEVEGALRPEAFDHATGDLQWVIDWLSEDGKIGQGAGILERLRRDVEWLNNLQAALRSRAGEGPESEYDKAIEALAPYLPDGWVVHDEIPMPEHSTKGTWITWYSKKPTMSDFGDGEDAWREQHGTVQSPIMLNIPRHPDWRLSLRRIQSGRPLPATQEGGAEPPPSEART